MCFSFDGVGATLDDFSSFFVLKPFIGFGTALKVTLHFLTKKQNVRFFVHITEHTVVFCEFFIK